MVVKFLYTLVSYCDKNSSQIIACYPSRDSHRYQNIVLSTVQDLMSLEEDTISITRDKFTVHILFGDMRYACLTANEAAQVDATQVAIYAQQFLNRVKRVYQDLPIVLHLTQDLSKISSFDLSTPLKKVMENAEYETLHVLPRIHGELEEVRRILLDSVEKLIDRGERLDEIVKKTQSLEITVQKDFRQSSRSLKKLTQNNHCFIAFTILVATFSTLAFLTLLYIEVFS